MGVVRLEDIQVPNLGEFKDVPVIHVLVAEGDQVEKEAPLITLESDKATMDVPSPFHGRINDLMITVGDTVSSGDVIMVMEVEVSDAQALVPPVEPAQRQLDLTADRATGSPPAEPVRAKPKTTNELREVSVPDIGDFSEVEVIEVAIAPGTVIKQEDPLITLESDKATMDVPAPFGGRVHDVLVASGDRVSQGVVIALVSPSDPAAGPASDSAPSRPTPAAVAETQAPADTERAENRRMPPPTLPPPVERAGLTKPHASPSVRRFARQLGCNLRLVRGTGPKGRILTEDVQNFVKHALTQPAQRAPNVIGAPAVEPLPDIDFSKFGAIETRPLGRVRKLSAAHLQRAWLHIPHVTHHDEADITDLEQFRQQAKDETADKGVRLTMLAFLMKASVTALKKNPEFNASLAPGGDNLILKNYYHIGVAVDTPDGLVVPVVRNVDQKGILDLARELGDVSERARSAKLTPGDLQGGTFTISSLGGIGGVGFTPIINAPEVAILGVARARQMPVYRDDKFVPRLMLPLSLSYDHRVIDGAAAARFTAYLARVLGDARLLLL